MDDSTPNLGRSTNVASSGPHAATSVFASVSQLAARTSSPSARSRRSPVSVNRTPEARAPGNVITAVNHRIRYQSAVQVSLPARPNHLYDATRTTLLPSAVSGRYNPGSPRRRSTTAAARPPSAIAISTTASINATARLLFTTNIERKRNHTTSSAINAAPARNDAASSRTALANASPDSVVPPGAGAAAIPVRRATRSASAAAARFSTPALQAVPS